MKSSVVVDHLSKHYNNGVLKAVDDVSFSVEPGELFGLIGPDGAGKSSIFRMLTTLLLPDGGSATVDGYDIVKDYKIIRGRVGYMPGKFSLYQDLTVEENLEFFATVFGTSVKENYDLVRDIYRQIEPFKNRRAGKLSGGMKQKLALSCALVHRPSVLFLDEPTTGVDAVSRKEFWEMLRRLRDQGITVLVSTPYMDEANLCDRIGLIQDGKLLSVATPADIVNSYTGTLYAIRSRSMYKLLNDLRSHPRVQSCFTFGDYLHVAPHPDSGDFAADIGKFLAGNGHSDVEIKQVEPNIEDCFIRLVDQD